MDPRLIIIDDMGPEPRRAALLEALARAIDEENRKNEAMGALTISLEKWGESLDKFGKSCEAAALEMKRLEAQFPPVGKRRRAPRGETITEMMFRLGGKS